MTDITYRQQQVFEVHSRSNKTCFEAAAAALAQFQPSALTTVEPVRLLPLLDRDLVIRHQGAQWSGRTSALTIYAGTREELGPDRKAFTNFSHGAEFIDIVLSEEQLEDLLRGGGMANQPRATVGHELGHAFMHAPSVWERAERASRVRRTDWEPPTQMNRGKAWADVAPYKNPELQAWAFGRALLMPLSAMQLMDDVSPASLADAFQVSIDLAKKHVKQLRKREILVDGRVLWTPPSAVQRRPPSHSKVCWFGASLKRST